MVIMNTAQNCDNRKNYSSSCPATVLNAIPSNCQKLSFEELKSGENYRDKAIVGKIYQINPLGKRANGYIRKLIIIDALTEELENPKKLTVFLLDQFAQDSDAAEIEGYIIISNFLLEKSTFHKDNELPLQILVKTHDCQVLFGRKLPSTDPNSSKKDETSAKNKKCSTDKDGTTAEVNKKRKKGTNVEEHHIILANQYEYVSLEALQESDSKVTYNVYGIVEKCDLKVIQGKRTQILDLVLTDETEAGFICSVFGAKDEAFPDVYPGDIIRIHRMQVYKFRSRLKGKCISPKFLLVFSKSNKGAKPKTVAKSFTFIPEDLARVRELFEWYNKKSEPKLISELNRGDYANILCQVIGVYCAKKTDAVILKIWDGTKTNLSESTHWGLKDEILDEKLFIVAKDYYVVLSVYGQHVACASQLKPRQYVEVRDAHLYSPQANPDDCKLCLHTGTKEGRGIEVLKDDDDRIKALKERLEKVVVGVMECGNQTDDLLSQNNSIFLNCDISAFTSSQRSTWNDENSATVEALNRPLNSRDEDAAVPQNTVISVIEAAIKPGQCTQEFGAGTQRDVQEIDCSEDGMSSPTQQDPVLNKTPVEFRMFLHNPPKQESPSFFPFTSDTDEEWWKSVPTISETDDHSAIKPSSIVEIVQHDVPHKFRALCAVLSYKPNFTSILEIIHLCCPKCLYITKNVIPPIDPHIEPFQEHDGLFYFYCPECCSKEANKRDWPVLQYTFLISLDLHDGTGPPSLEVHLWQENAVKFFKGITPEQALKDQTACDSIFQMLWSICPNCRPFNSKETRDNNYTAYPILNCCILSYTTPGGTFYQIFDTRLL